MESGLPYAKGSINEGHFKIFPIFCPWNIIRIVVNIIVNRWS